MLLMNDADHYRVDWVVLALPSKSIYLYQKLLEIYALLSALKRIGKRKLHVFKKLWNFVVNPQSQHYPLDYTVYTNIYKCNLVMGHILYLTYSCILNMQERNLFAVP